MQVIDPASVGLSAAGLKQLDDGMQRYVDRGQMAGVLTVLARRGRVAHVGCHGRMDIAAGRPMREDAIFRIFSMTKPVTSLAVLMVCEEGRIDLRTPIARFIPALGDLRVLRDPMDLNSEQVPLERPITIYDLLTHTSGLGYGLDNLLPVDALLLRDRILRMDETLAEKMARLAGYPLHHQPGFRYTYSIATDVLARLVEIMSGLTLDEFFRQRIFGPLGMIDTGFHVPAGKLDRLATLYTFFPETGLVDMATLAGVEVPHFMTGLWVDKSQPPHFFSGGAGLVSTAADFLRFALMMRNRGELDGVRLVSSGAIEQMTNPHLRQEQFFIPGCSYGLGVTVVTDPVQAQLPSSVGAYGGGGAAGTDFWFDPAKDLIGIMMVQYASYTPINLGLDFKVLSLQAIEE